MGTVKYSGPVASFHCPTEATIRSLKVHFSPKQLGSGTPSPENVREIVGWDGVEVYHSGKNLFDASKLPTTVNNYYTEQDGYIYINHNYGLGWVNQPTCLFLQPGTYTASLKKISGTANESAELRSAEGGWVWESWGVYSRPTKTYTDKRNMAIRITGEKNTVGLQVELGSTATAYEPYRGSTIDYEFGVLGKNKLNNDNEFWEVGSMDAMGGKDNRTTRIRTKDFISAFPNTTYTISISEGYSFAWDEFYSGTHKYYYGWQSGSFTFTTHSDVNQLFFIIKKDDTTNITPSILEDDCHIQLELGSTATAYEPYDPKHTVYGGWVDLISGEVSEEYKVTNAEDLQVSYYTRAYEQMDYFDFRFKNRQVILDTLCNTAKYYSTRQDATRSGVPSYWIGYLTIGGVSRPYIGFSFPSTFFSTHPTADNVEDSYQEILNKCSILFTEQLSTPITYSLAPTQLQTFLGQNNIWSNADYVEVEYDLHETQDILARKQFIIANQPHVEKLAAASLQNFNTNMVAPLKECKVYFEPVQEGSGDPSPDNVRTINGWTGLNAKFIGKNWIDLSYISDANSYSNVGNYAYMYTDDIQLVPNTKYRFVWSNYDSSKLDTVLLYVSGTNQYIVDSNAVKGYRQYTSGFTTSSAGTIKFGINKQNYSTIQDALDAIFTNGNLLLQLGTNDELYEPYSGTTLPIDWITEAGTIYGGYVDLVTGEVWETWVKNTIQNIFTGVYTYGTTQVFLSGIKGDVSSGKSDIVSNKYPTISGLMPISQVPNMADQFLAVRAVYGNLILKDTQYTTVEELHAAMGDTEVCYHITTPILITTLTPTAIKTLRGTNNIWSNSNGDITVQFWRH